MIPIIAPQSGWQWTWSCRNFTWAVLGMEDGNIWHLGGVTRWNSQILKYTWTFLAIICITSQLFLCREEVYGRWKQLLASSEATSPVLSRPSDLTVSPNLLRPLPVQTNKHRRQIDTHSLNLPDSDSRLFGVLGDIYFVSRTMNFVGSWCFSDTVVLS
jgi:hypothetical protein